MLLSGVVAVLLCTQASELEEKGVCARGILEWLEAGYAGGCVSVCWLCTWVQWRCCQADWRCWIGVHVVDTLSEWSPQVIVLGGSWCCCVELLPTQRLMLCSFEGATEGHCSGAED